MNDRTKKQHFIPRFYLRQFCNSEEKLWTYDCDVNTLRQTTPDNTAYEVNIYSPLDDEGNRLDFIEESLSEIESSAANILPELVGMKSIDAKAKADFSVFLATMFARSPAQIRQFAKLEGEISNWAGAHLIERLNQKKRKDGTLTDFDIKMQEFYREKLAYKIKVDRRIGLQAFGMVEPLSKLIQNMRWAFEISENQQLLTSDNPFFWLAAKPLPAKSPYGFGLGHPYAVVPFPLSPGLILRLDWEKAPNWTKHSLNKKRARLANQYQAKHKNRFLYFKDSDYGFCKLGKKYKEPAEQLKSGYKSAQIDVVRKLN